MIIINDGAFGVAVTGDWGTGKSWYMSALKSELENIMQLALASDLGYIVRKNLHQHSVSYWTRLFIAMTLTPAI